MAAQMQTTVATTSRGAKRKADHESQPTMKKPKLIDADAAMSADEVQVEEAMNKLAIDVADAAAKQKNDEKE